MKKMTNQVAMAQACNKSWETPVVQRKCQNRDTIALFVPAQ